MDRATGLERFGARDYEAGVGRWICKDAIGFRGGDWNLWVYVGNQPTCAIDATGRAHIEQRPILGLPFIVGVPGSVSDLLNFEVLHEEIFFDDGSGQHLGTEPGYSAAIADPEYPANKDQYKRYPGQFDDALMHQAIQATPTSKWNFFGNQCQNWTSRVAETYKRLDRERQRKRCK
jgi:RHS repeat-associated protein